jgi:hypothetical protein
MVNLALEHRAHPLLGKLSYIYNTDRLTGI